MMLLLSKVQHLAGFSYYYNFGGTQNLFSVQGCRILLAAVHLKTAALTTSVYESQNTGVSDLTVC